MAFPYSYKRKLLYYKKELKDRHNKSADIPDVISRAFLSKKPIQSEIRKGTQVYTFVAPVFNFKYTVEINLKYTENEIIINYEVNFENLIRIILILIILTAFFSFLSVQYFLIASGLITFLFFGVSYLSIDHFIENIIKQTLSDLVVSENIVERLSEEQLSWMNDKNKCSACGEELTEFDLQCPECGIKLKRNRHSIPLDVSKYKDRNITYHLKK